MSAKPYLFRFWDGLDRPGFIDVTMARQVELLGDHFEIVTLDWDSAATWIEDRDRAWRLTVPEDLGEQNSLEGKHWSLFTDYLRIALIARHGGMWLDADIMPLPGMEVLADLVATREFVGMEGLWGGLTLGVIGGRPGSKMLRTLHERAQNVLDETETASRGMRWGDMAKRSAEEMGHRHLHDARDCFVFPFGDLFYFDGSKPLSPTATDLRLEDFVNPHSRAVTFWNSRTTEAERALTAEELLAGGSIIAQAARWDREPPPLDMSRNRAENTLRIVWMRQHVEQPRIQKFQAARARWKAQKARQAETTTKLKARANRLTQRLSHLERQLAEARAPGFRQSARQTLRALRDAVRRRLGRAPRG